MAHLNAGEPHDSRALDGETEVTCPYCGETVTIVLDSASGPDLVLLGLFSSGVSET